jgi:hypothetical protein
MLSIGTKKYCSHITNLHIKRPRMTEIEGYIPEKWSIFNLRFSNSHVRRRKM